MDKKDYHHGLLLDWEKEHSGKVAHIHGIPDKRYHHITEMTLIVLFSISIFVSIIVSLLAVHFGLPFTIITLIVMLAISFSTSYDIGRSLESIYLFVISTTIAFALFGAALVIAFNGNMIISFAASLIGVLYSYFRLGDHNLV